MNYKNHQVNMLKRLMGNAQIKKLTQYGIGQGFNVIAPFIVIPFIILKCGIILKNVL